MTKRPASSRSKAGVRGSATAAVFWPVHVFALCGFGVAQPLYELLGRFAPFLVAHASESVDLVVLAASLSLGLPLALVLPSLALARLSRPAGWRLHLVVLGLLAMLLAAQLVRDVFEATFVVLVAAVATAVLAAWAYARFALARRVLSWLAIAGVVFPLLFLFGSPIRSLLMPERAGDSASLSRPPTTPVVVLVLDEFPLFSLLAADETLDAERFPNIAELARESMWYRNATTVAQNSAYGVPAILSGRYPFEELLLPVVNDYRQNLFTLLGGSYNLNVYETATRLCPSALCTGAIVRPVLRERLRRLFADLSAVYLHLVAPRDLARALPDIGAGWQGFWRKTPERLRSKGQGRAEERRVRKYRWDHPRETFEQFVESIESFPPATLHYLHVLLPHAPWIYLPDGHSFRAVRPPGLENRIWTGTEWQIAQSLQRHLLQVGFVDRMLGELRERLESAGIYDDSLTILVSDHGSGFRRGEARRLLTPVPGRNLPDIANVPLIVKFPGGRPRGIDDRNAETIDVLPTILDVVGVDAGDLELDGASLRAAADPTREVKRIYPTAGHRSERGTPIEFHVDDLRGRREAVRFKLDYLGAGDWENVFAMGRYGSLAGAAPDHPALQPEAEELTLDRAESYREVDSSQEFLPLWISGELGGAGDRWVAVVVNGRVAVVTETYLVEHRERVAALVPPASLRQNENRIEVRALRRSWLAERDGDAAD